MLALPACGAFTAVGIGSDDPEVPEGAKPAVGEGGAAAGGGDGGAPSIDSGQSDADAGCALGTPEHCGACGHSCKGAKCTADRCEPALFASATGVATSLSARDGTVAWVTDAALGYRCNPASCVPTMMTYGAIDRLALVGPSRAALSQGAANLVTAVDWSMGSNQSVGASGGAAAFAVEGSTVYYAERNAPNVYRGVPGMGTVLVARNEAVRSLATVNATLYVAFAGASGVARFDPPLGASPTPVELPSLPRLDTGAISAVVVAAGRGCWLKAGAVRCDDGGGPPAVVVPSGVDSIATDGQYVYFTDKGTLARIQPNGKGRLELVKLDGAVVVDALAPSEDGWLYFAVTDGLKHEIRRVAK